MVFEKEAEWRSCCEQPRLRSGAAGGGIPPTPPLNATCVPPSRVRARSAAHTKGAMCAWARVSCGSIRRSPPLAGQSSRAALTEAPVTLTAKMTPLIMSH